MLFWNSKLLGVTEINLEKISIIPNQLKYSTEMVTFLI